MDPAIRSTLPTQMTVAAVPAASNRRRSEHLGTNGARQPKARIDAREEHEGVISTSKAAW